MTRAQRAHYRQRVLERFRRHGNVSKACEEVGVDRRLVYKWRDADDAFALAFGEAELEATEHLEAEAHRRAVEGVQRKKFTTKGQPVIDPATGEQYVEREFSDTLLIVLLKARAPHKYRENIRQELTGADGSPISTRVEFVPLMLRLPHPPADAS